MITEKAGAGEGARSGSAGGGLGHFAKFLVVGGLNTVVGYGLFAAFIIAGLGAPLALALATVLGVLFNFKSFGLLVFRNGDGRLLPRFVAVYAGQYVVNLMCLRWLAALDLSPLLAQLLLLPPLSLASFLLMRRLVFRARPRPRSDPPR